MMTVQADKSATAIDGIVLDAPIFDPQAFRLNDEQAAIIARARQLGQAVFAGRAAAYDREAKFPTENYRDLHRGRPARHLHPQEARRARRRLPHLCARRRRDRPLLRRDRADLEHACLLDAVDRPAGRRSRHGRGRARAEHERGAPCTTSASSTTARSIRSRSPKAARPRPARVAFGTEAKPVDGGWLVNGKKIFASLSGHADYYGVLCTEIARGRKGLAPQHALSRAAGQGRRASSVVGDWDPLGMRGTVSRTLMFKDVFVPRGRGADAARRLFSGGDRAGRTCS